MVALRFMVSRLRCSSPFLPRSDQGGMALVVVLWLVAALSLFVGSMGGQVRQQARILSAERESLQARARAEEVIYAQAAQMLLSRSSVQGRELISERVSGQGGMLEVQAVPWAGLVNINGASVELLQALFRGAGMAAGQAVTVAREIDRVRQERAQAKEPFWEVPTELLDVPGMNWLAFERVQDFLVAENGRRSGINEMAMPPDLKQMLRAAGYMPAGGVGSAAPLYAMRALVPGEGGKVMLYTLHLNLEKNNTTGAPWTVVWQSQRWLEAMP